MSDDDRDDFIEATGFLLGHLPVRYLGVHLISGKLSSEEYDAFITRITKQMNHWTSQYLSYSRILQLIKAVTYSTINYWCAYFILPKMILKEIQKKCTSFLWSGKSEGCNNARVSWYFICKPYAEAGLGLRDLCILNQASIMRCIWMLFSKAVSLWVAWVRKNILKSCFWSMKIPGNCSWCWRKILQLREVPRSRIMYEVLEDGDWRLPRSADPQSLEIQRAAASISIGSHDVAKWEGKINGVFNLSKTYHSMRETLPHVSWHSSIWFKGNVPRASFILWVDYLNRLPTKDRLCSWGVIHDNECDLCEMAIETRDHLLCGCFISGSIWSRILALIGLHHDSRSWDLETQWLRDYKGNRSARYFLKLLWSVFVYIICLR